jgi:flagellar basal-body rod protein FlgB|tara:strand:- start:101 stop:487 length:387 start_codon:yes stop_codon:yes gene_type:complete
MPSFTEHLGFHASALQLRSRRNEMLASNIANAATPNFKARDLDFDTELKRINKIGNIQTTNNSHFASIQKRIGKDSVFRLPIHPSLDGNTVEMAVEQMQFSENVMRYQTTLSFLNNKISGLRSAIKGE